MFFFNISFCVYLLITICRRSFLNFICPLLMCSVQFHPCICLRVKPKLKYVKVLVANLKPFKVRTRWNEWTNSNWKCIPIVRVWFSAFVVLYFDKNDLKFYYIHNYSFINTHVQRTLIFNRLIQLNNFDRNLTMYRLICFLSIEQSLSIFDHTNSIKFIT